MTEIIIAEKEIRDEFEWLEYAVFCDLLASFPEMHFYKQLSSAFNEEYRSSFPELTQTRNKLARIEEEEMDGIFWEMYAAEKDLRMYIEENNSEAYESDEDYYDKYPCTCSNCRF